jgi:ABC-type maltose transport system permease subunit
MAAIATSGPDRVARRRAAGTALMALPTLLLFLPLQTRMASGAVKQ